MKWHKKVKNYLGSFYQQFWEQSLITSAEALAFNTLLAFVPVTGLVLLYLHSIGLTDQWISRVQDFILSFANAAGEEGIEKTIRDLTSGVGTAAWGWAGLGALFYAYWGLVSEFGQALDRIFHVRQRPEAEGKPNRSKVRMFLIRVQLVVFLPIVLLISMALSSWVADDPWIGSVTGFLQIKGALGFAVAWFLNSVILSVVFFYTPQKKVPYRNAAKAAGIACAAIGVAQYLFRIAAAYSFTNQKIYGVFIAIPLFLFWVFLCWLVILCSILSVNVRTKSPTSRTGK